ncbi:PREDICTED: syntaxin-8 [Drosophila arizonae]|uniref:Syntaxin-8 n=1 Tax=Drosophila arizonae TaxID=7263 RepID=A0ABM1P208_DROAR|nr:PREDICTED: syntaxin-8 [Drosophila arizonae]
MSLVDHDSWDIEFEGCERLRHQLLGLLHKRRQLGGAVASPEYAKLTNSIDVSREQLAKDVKHLKVVLDNAITWESCSEHELQQRRINFDKLNSDLRSIDATINSNSARPSTSSTSVWQQMGTTAAAAAPPSDIVSLKLTQAAILEEQDRGLEALSATLSRQRQLATQVYEEVDDQHNILDNLANTMDRVEAGVQRETRTIGQVTRKDSTWGYWLVIVLLFVAILIVVLV